MIRSRNHGAAPLPAGALTLAVLVVSLAGCGPSPGAVVGDGAALFSCETETRAVPYAPDLTRASASGAFQAVLVLSEPGPPIKGTNTWTVKLLDGAGAPQDGLTVTARPFMPDHAHGSTVKTAVTPMSDGLYLVKPLYLYMPGYWEITLSPRPSVGGKDDVMFPICIPG